MKRVVKIVLGMYLLIALALVVMPQKITETAWTTRIENFVKHTVQPGDTLETLAKIYGTSIIRIVSKNGIAPETKLYKGQKLVIPVSGYKEKLII